MFGREKNSKKRKVAKCLQCERIKYENAAVLTTACCDSNTHTNTLVLIFHRYQ